MKKLVNYSVFTVLFCLTSVLISSCGSKDREIEGYIPENQKPFYVWSETYPGSKTWECRPQVVVILEKGDTVIATFSEGTFPGSYAVRYRDSYPPAVGKKIGVRMGIMNDLKYYIFDTSIKKEDTGPVSAPAYPN